MDLEFREAKRMREIPFSDIRKMMEKATLIENQGVKVIHLELGRPDFDTPINIKESAKKAIDEGKVFYTSNYGITELRTAISEKLHKENGIIYNPQTEIIVTVGAAEGLFVTLLSLLNEGDEILVPNPGWLNYIHVSKMAGAVPISYSLLEENYYQIDIGEIERKITDKTKALVLISPNNPTGGVLQRETLKKLSEIAIRHNLIVISDEIYEKIIYDGNTHTSIASLPGMRERTVTINGFSKAFSMTGWRLAYVAAPVEIINTVVKMHQYCISCAVSFVQYAAIEALKNTEHEVKRMVSEYKKRRDYVVQAINSIDGLSCKIPCGAFYIFINVKELNMSAEEIVEFLLNDAGVALVAGTAFGDEGEGYVRLSYANSYENLVEACERIKSSVKKLY